MTKSSRRLLPWRTRCHVPRSKVISYLLEIDHLDGAPKARFFMAFGFSPDRPQVLVEALESHPLENFVVWAGETTFGRKYVVQCSLRTPDGRNPCIMSVWIVEGGERRPRLVTAYPADN